MCDTGLFHIKIHDKLNESVDAASLAFFRIIFGCILLVSQLRFLWKGWD